MAFFFTSSLKTCVDVALSFEMAEFQYGKLLLSFDYTTKGDWQGWAVLADQGFYFRGG